MSAASGKALTLAALDPTVGKRLWSHTIKWGECIIYTGTISPNGHGSIRNYGSLLKAHRVSFVLAGPVDIPVGMVVAHECSRPACINPEHLFLCTQAENVRDRDV